MRLLNYQKRAKYLFILVFTISTVLWSSGFVPAQPEAGLSSGDENRVKRFELKKTKMVDAARLISEWFNINVVATEAAGQKEVTLYLQEVAVRDIIETICKISGLWYRYDKEGNTFRIMTAAEYQKDIVVFREDTARVFTLLHSNVIGASTAIRDLYGNRVILSLGTDEDSLADATGFGLGMRQFSWQVPGATNIMQQQMLGATGATGATNIQAGSGKQTVQKMLDESLTPDQIAELDRRKQDKDQQSVSADSLKEVSRQEPPIYITVNRRHNLVIVRTSDTAAMKDIEKLIMEIDRPTPQVLLEMKILELSLSDTFRSVFDFDFQTGPQSTGPATTQPPNPQLPQASTGARNVLGVGNFPLEGGTLIYQFLNDQIRARIQLFNQDNRIKVLATPLILASNNQPARVFVGEERVLITGVNTKVIATATGPTTSLVEPITEIRNIGNTLLIRPRINADRTVTLSIQQDSSSVLSASASIPVVTQTGVAQQFPIDTVNTANLTGTVVVKDNLTVAIGGLIRTAINKETTKVPLLGDIPILGRLFRRDVDEKIKSELILLVTPHVLMTPAEGKEITNERMEELSDHPYRKEGDKALHPFPQQKTDEKK